MLNEKLKELEEKRKKIKKEKLEKKKRAERRKKREAKRKLDEKKALEKRKKLQARRQAAEDAKLAKLREIEKQEELIRKEKERKQKFEDKEKRKKQKETEKFLKERQKKHQKYLELKVKMEQGRKELLEKEILESSEKSKDLNNSKKQTSKKGKRVKKEKKKINFLGIVFLLVCISILAYSSYQIYIWIKSTQDLITIEEEVIEKVVKEVKDTSKEYSIDINFEELTKINSDIVGWIYIKNTDVNYPIMQTKDNDYYLKKNIYKEYSSCGSIFLDCNTDKFNEDNTVIYGHNLKNQKMFADLKKVYDGDFGKDVYIEVYDTENNFIKYKIFATYMVEPTLEVVKKDFKISEKKKYIDNAYNQSTVKFNCGFNYQKDLLTLVTCDNTGEKRIIVNALRVN